MLVLSRKRGETVVLKHGEVTITVVVVDAVGRCRIGIQAPREVAVIRGELTAAWRIEDKPDKGGTLHAKTEADSI